jgi:hypothetical protein
LHPPPAVLGVIPSGDKNRPVGLGKKNNFSASIDPLTNLPFDMIDEKGFGIFDL